LQIKVRKSTTDLLIDQLSSIFTQLAAAKVPTNKHEKKLEEVRGKWDNIKKAQPQVKTDVEPIQINEAQRIKQEAAKFSSKVCVKYVFCA
jgi:dynein heavy chain